jgi:hypothetical protein
MACVRGWQGQGIGTVPSDITTVPESAFFSTPPAKLALPK